MKSKTTKAILVTGASRGIWKGIAEELLSRGYFVIGVFAKSDKEATKFAKKHSRLRMEKVDLTDRTQISQFVESLKGKKLDGIVNNAGAIEFESPTNYDIGIWDRT